MTSPQHRIATGQMMTGARMTSPVNPYGQQNIVQSQMIATQQQNRFIRPMMNIQRPGQGMMTAIQQQQQQQTQQMQVNNRQNNAMYNPNSPLGSPQPIASSGIANQQQMNMDHIQNQRTMQLVQQRQMVSAPF